MSTDGRTRDARVAAPGVIIDAHDFVRATAGRAA